MNSRPTKTEQAEEKEGLDIHYYSVSRRMETKKENGPSLSNKHIKLCQKILKYIKYDQPGVSIEKKSVKFELSKLDYDKGRGEPLLFSISYKIHLKLEVLPTKLKIHFIDSDFDTDIFAQAPFKSKKDCLNIVKDIFDIWRLTDGNAGMLLSIKLRQLKNKGVKSNV